ncbi:acetyl/propionyl/methylcrotonyl-CoA carboxylase subunit alpha [Erysipelothrix urinaevulpis]|uniref:acetyl-CoA carboxylase biotin carboxylase subunit n=1 Tax=Erysipelothrix urinaevulpis TaxID=2683717 RepID=UPI001357DA8A|nr:acetyl-CoA carboxylase biotin carboxylase subunit [Erysipelothrix urinaevulpis]
MKLIQKVLIANRGEIAIRIIRSLREMNIKSVAIYSTVDKDSLHVMLADEAVCIGDHRLINSYLNKNAILQAAINTQAQAIHPGYGLLSENASFAKACHHLGLEFIGPHYKTIELMGDKQSARETIRAAGVPIVPGSKGLVSNLDEAHQQAKHIGFPLLVKATAGGGGKGMRICYDKESLSHAYQQAVLEAQTVFGDGSVYMERFIENPRHIEVQILGDKHENIVHLFERECSVQRNNQKMIEEAPAHNIKPATQKKLYDVALKAAHSIQYESAGTLEFIMDKDENFYFIEMNTRIQVEHPITEQITGVDLIKEQIRIAEGRRLSVTQSDLKINGCSLELRINAEDPYDKFKPVSGKIGAIHFPGGHGIRVDSFLYQGYTILPFYDSMIAKIIVHSSSREDAIEKAIRSMEELNIEGIKTNQEFQLEILLSEAFLDNNYDTSLVEKFLKGEIQ